MEWNSPKNENELRIQYKYILSEVLELFKGKIMREREEERQEGRALEDMGCEASWNDASPDPGSNSEKAWELRLSEGVKAFFVKSFSIKIYYL